MRSTARPAALLALLAALALLGGCGGKSDKEKLADDVNEICRELGSALGGLRAQPSLPEIGRQGKRLIPAVDRAAKRLAKVRASPEVRRELGDEYLQFVATFRAQAIAYGAIVGAAEKNDARALRTLLGQLEQLDRANRRRARQLGFDDCASA